MAMLSGCLKEDKPFELLPRNANSTYVKLDCNVEDNHMVFLNLSTGIHTEAPNSAWHIALDNRPNGHSARTNLTHASYQLFSTQDTDFNINPKDFMKEANLMMDSVANWFGNNIVNTDCGYESDVYIYHHKPDVLGEGEKLFKFQILSADHKKYRIKYHNLLNINCKEVILVVEKNPKYNFTYVNFEENEAVYLEPRKEDWDIVFTQYRDMVIYEVDNTFYPYQVLGALINPHKTYVYEMNNKKAFVNVNSEDCKYANWGRVTNTVGFDWKSYSINNAVYETDSSMIWLLKDQQEDFYKFRFINFYNDLGESGYPTLEYAKF